jgi:hypothetical protein
VKEQPKQNQKTNERLKAKPTLKEAEVQQRLKELEEEIQTSPLAVTPVYDDVSSGPALTKHASTNAKAKPSTGVAQATGFNVIAFWVLAFLSLILAQVPGISLLFTPITQFTTLVHELGHAIVCILTGGHVIGLTIVGDGAGHGGLTQFEGGWQFFTAQAGYLGTAVFGCFLIYLGQFAKLSKFVLAALGVAIGLASIFLVGANVFTTGFAGVASFIWGMALCVSLLWLSKKLSPAAANLAVLFLAIQTALNSLSCVFGLLQAYLGFFPVGGWSDATIMAQMTHIPALLWSLFWFLASLCMVGFTLWHTYGKRLLPGNSRNLISMK